MNDSELNELMYEINQNNLSDQRINLDILLNRPIIVIADLGFWNGRKSGYKVIESGNISDCLYSDCDYNKWYVDKYGDLRCTAVHHDGTNYYLYRSFKDSASERQINRLKDLYMRGKYAVRIYCALRIVWATELDAFTGGAFRAERNGSI